MDFCRKTILLLIFSSFMSVGWGQDCVDGIEVELWGECYNIEETTYLDLSHSGLTGGIPPDIENLTNLRGLELSGNQLNGDIPPEIGNLTNLTDYLSLGFNQLSGEIPPEIGNLTNLTDFLSLHYNQLTGEIPSEIGNLTNLRELGLDNNQLSGEIPSEIGNLDNLELLWLSNNQFGGLIPESICDLSILWDQYNEWGDPTFHIDNNSLCPPYPECIEDYVGEQDTSECEEPSLCDEGYVELWGECYTITFTTYLDLSEMGFSGEIPSEIGNLNNLTVLDLGGNQLSGEIPYEICNLTNLTELELGGNQLSGEIPSCIGNLTNLTFLHLEYNQLSGEIPSDIGNLTNLIWLNFIHNQLSGEIPSSICNLDMDWSDPNNFNIYENQLCSPYPECIEDYVGEQDTSECEESSLCDEVYTEIDGECYYQSDLDVLEDIIDNSQAGGNPPPSDLSPIELCSQVWIDGRLVNLYCSGDDLEQDESYIDFELDIPESIGNLTSLMSFGLEYNNLSSLPESIGNLTNLVGLLLHHNQLTSLPESIGNLMNLTGLDVDNNQLNSLPESIGNLTNLTRLLLAVNQLTSLPDNIGYLTNLTELYLFSNNLISLPESIGNLLSLELLWLQNNQITNLPESICNLVENDCSIFLQENEICSPYPGCIEDYIGYQDTSECGEPDPQIGDECVTQDGLIGFYDCELCCWDEWIIENWLGDGWCDYLGGCGFEGPLFNCPELGYDCGDCAEDWNETAPSGLCSDDCLFPGDVNSDSILNILDIVSMITLILDGEYDECGDVNSDGDLNILDVITFVNFILSIP